MIDDDWFLTVFTYFSAAVVLALIGLGVAIARQPTFALLKDDWECTRGHKETRSIYIGKALYPSTVTICTQWTAKEAVKGDR